MMSKVRRLDQILTLALALGCLAGGWTVVRDALTRLPGAPLRDAVVRFEPLTPPQEALFLESRQTGAAADRRAVGRMLLAGPADDGSAAGRQRLTHAILELEDAVARAPADTFAWADLSLARLRRDGPTPAGLAALRLSLAAAPAEPALAVWRINMLLAHEGLFTGDDPALLRRQAVIAWHYAPWHTAHALNDQGRIEVLRQGLATSSDDLLRLEQELARR